MPDYITHVQENGFYGWPWWYIGARQDPRHSGKHPKLKDTPQVTCPRIHCNPSACIPYSRCIDTHA